MELATPKKKKVLKVVEAAAWPLSSTLKIIQQIYVDKIKADAVDDACKNPRQNLVEYVGDWFKNQCVSPCWLHARLRDSACSLIHPPARRRHPPSSLVLRPPSPLPTTVLSPAPNLRPLPLRTLSFFHPFTPPRPPPSFSSLHAPPPVTPVSLPPSPMPPTLSPPVPGTVRVP